MFLYSVGLSLGFWKCIVDTMVHIYNCTPGTPFTHTTIMSTNNPPSTLAQLNIALQLIFKSVHTLYKKESDKKPLTDLLINFIKAVITPIIQHNQLYPSCSPSIHLSTNSEELKQI